MPADIRAFQIFYDEQTRALLDGDFEPLDNSNSARPDWYEYWPIRRYLSENPLDDSAFYGFLSPRFREKTRLTGAQVKEFVRQHADADVVTFSPFPCHGASFVNVFEHGEFLHRGLFESSVRFFAELEPKVKLETVVTHSRNTVFSNFFLAKGGFWRAWKGVFDRLFEAAEAPGSPLHAHLVQRTDHRGQSLAQMKIFVMERVVTFLLSTSGFKVATFPPFRIPLSWEFEGHFSEIVMLDALKLSFSRTDNPDYMRLYVQLRDRLLAKLAPAAQSEPTGAKA
jgi:hypothetical protein